MAKFTLTITNNETGKIESIETNAIIAGVDNEKDGGTNEIFITACNAIDFAATLIGAKNAVKKAENSNPVVAMLAEVMIKEKESEGENDE